MPQQIDPNIALGVRPPSVQSPTDAMDAAYRMQDLIALGQERRLESQKRQQAIDDDNATRKYTSQYTDPTGVTDWDKVTGALASEGRYGVVEAINGKLATQKTAHLQQMKDDLENQKQAFSLAHTYVNQIDESDPERAEMTFQIAKKNVGRVLGNQYADAMGDHYDKDRVEQARRFGEDQQQTLGRQKTAIELADAALKLTNDKDVDRQKKVDAWKKTTSAAISGTRNQQELDGVRSNIIAAAGSDVGNEVLSNFDSQWTPDTPQRANDADMTANEREQRALQTKQQAETVRANKAREAIQKGREDRLAKGKVDPTMPEGVKTWIAELSPELDGDGAQQAWKDAKEHIMGLYPQTDPKKVSAALTAIYGKPLTPAEQEAKAITAQLTGQPGGPKPKASPTPSPKPAAPAKAKPVITEDQLQQGMTANKWTRSEAIAQAEARGFDTSKLKKQ